MLLPSQTTSGLAFMDWAGTIALRSSEYSCFRTVELNQQLYQDWHVSKSPDQELIQPSRFNPSQLQHVKSSRPSWGQFSQCVPASQSRAGYSSQREQVQLKPERFGCFNSGQSFPSMFIALSSIASTPFNKMQSFIPKSRRPDYQLRSALQGSRSQP